MSRSKRVNIVKIHATMTRMTGEDWYMSRSKRINVVKVNATMTSSVNIGGRTTINVYLCTSDSPSVRTVRRTVVANVLVHL